MQYGKRNVFIWGLVGTVLFTAAFYVLPATAAPAMFLCEILRQFAYGFTIPLLWAMMADVADFSEWKTGRRATAIVFSAIVFALKAGLGLRRGDHGLRAVALRLRAERGAGRLTALVGIRNAMSIFPAITFADLRGRAAVLRDRQDDRDHDDRRTGGAAEAVRVGGTRRATREASP